MATTPSRQALFLTLITLATAIPNNYYHQEYKYKTSSSSYRNNELQHQNDNEGFMSKQGDLEGRTIPLVNSHSQHSEYVNPKLRDSRYIGQNAYNGDTSEGYMDVDTSGGNMGAQFMRNYESGTKSGYGSASYGSGGYGSGGFGSSGYGGNLASGSLTGNSLSNRNSYSSSYGSSSAYATSYSVPSSLRSITQQLQDDYARELQQNSYGYNRDFNQLEAELRQNVSQRIQNVLQSRYGPQSIRSGLSYSLNNGRPLSNANYEHRELLDLQRQVENDLLSQLRRQYYSQSSASSAYQATNSNFQRYTTSSTTMRPYTSYTTHIPVYVPSYTSTTTRIPIYSEPYAAYSSSSQRGESITNIATRVQSDLDHRLNTVLDNVHRNSQYDDYNTLLNRLQNEVRSNITYLLDREIQRTYGNQVLRDGYMYNTGSYDNQYNYSVRDLENLKQQIESNLLQKLNRDLQRYRTNQSTQSYTSNRFSDYGTGSNTGYRGDAGTAGYTSRPTSASMVPLITGSKSHNSYNYQASYGTSGISANTISQLQSQLQSDLSRQLQAAINRNRYGYSGYNNGQRNYQVSFQELSDELNRNLTRQLTDLQSRYSSGYSGSSAQFEELRNQVQDNLMRELQQGLQHSYSSSSSYSASSSSSNYRPARANLGSLTTYPTGEDCDGQLGHAVYKRSPYRHRHRSYQQDIEDSNLLQQQERQQLQQEVDSDLTQHQEPSEFGRLSNLNQEKDDSETFQVGGQQQIDEGGLTQQQEQEDFGRLQVPEQRPFEYKPKHPKNSYFSQQTENDDFKQFQIGGQQKIIDDDLTQQQEQEDFGRIRSLVDEQRPFEYKPAPKHPKNSYLPQQTEYDNFEQLQNGGQRQIIDEGGLTQQQEQEDFGKIQSPYAPQSADLTQQLEQHPKNNYLSQQIENDGYEQLQVGQQKNDEKLTQQQEQTTHLTQESENDSFQLVQQEDSGKIQSPYAPQSEDLIRHEEDTQPPKTEDFQQQTQNENSYGNLQIGSEQQLNDSDLNQKEEQFEIGHRPTSQSLPENLTNSESLIIGQQLEMEPQAQKIEQEPSDLTQQQEKSGYGKLQNVPKVDDSVQQMEDGFKWMGILPTIKPWKPQEQIIDAEMNQNQVQDLDLTQKQEPSGTEQSQQKLDDEEFEKIQQFLSNVRVEANQNQKQDNNDDLMQIAQKPNSEQSQLGKLNSNQQQEDDFGAVNTEKSNKYQGQSEITQQEEEIDFGKFQLSNQREQVNQNQIDDEQLTQQQENDFIKRVTTIKNIEGSTTASTTAIPSSTSRMDREFLEKINRENDMLLEMVRQRAIERQRQVHRQQDDHQYGHRGYGAYSPYEPRPYNTGYGGRSYSAPAQVQEIGTPYHHQSGYQKPLEVESVQEVEVIEPINVDPDKVTAVKSEHVNGDNVEENAVQPEEATTPKPGFWKRLGNKITTGAKAIKEKIVG